MVNRVYGLSGSGIDVDDLVKKAMKAQQTRYDSLYKKKTQLEWKKSDYNELYTAINSFRSNTAFNYKLQSTLNPKKAASNNTALVDVTASADAAGVNHKLIIKNTAEGVNITSTGTLTPAGNDKSSLATQFGISTNKFTVKLTNGTESKEITVDPTQSIYDFVSNVSAAGVHMSASYDATLDRFFLYSTNTGATTGIDLSGSSAAGQDFVFKCLKIPATGKTDLAATASSTAIGFNGAKATLASQFPDLTTPFSININTKIDNKDIAQTINVDPATDTLETIMAKVNNPASTAKAMMDYNPADGKITIASKANVAIKVTCTSSNFLKDLKLDTTALAAGATGFTGSDKLVWTPQKALLTTPLSMTGDSSFTDPITLKINGQSVSVTNTDTVQDLINKINGMGANAAASYDETTGKFSLSASSGVLDLSQNDASALSFLSGRLKLSVVNAPKGKDADIILDGTEFSESSNTFSIAGVTYTLKGADKDTTVGISVANDIDKLVKNVQDFVDAYNKILDKVNTEIDEKNYRDYLPLTTAEKAEMKDTEITMWEQKAKSGLLHNDATLQSLAYGLRDELSSPISGLTSKYNSASSIGITTGAYNEKGKLYLNESVLRTALQEDPNAVQNIFGAKSDDASQQGIAVKMYDFLNNISKQIVTTAGATAGTDYDTDSALAKEIKDYDDRMYDMSKKLKTMEDNYYSRFNAMEQALSKLNQQSSWLTQQFATK